MKSVFPVLLAAAAVVLPRLRLHAESPEQMERIAASYVLVFGRAPTPAEWTAGEAAGPVSIATLMAAHRERLARDAAVMRATTVRAFQDTFGREPRAKDLAAVPAHGITYTALIQQHLADLAAHPAEYKRVIQRAYEFLLRRGPYPAEVEYWARQSPLPYALLLAALEDWARRNQPGLMVTSGEATVSVNSEFLTAVRLSPEVAAEARSAIGMAAPAGTPPNRHFVGAGGAGIASRGGIHFTAAGADNLPAPTAPGH